MNIKKLEEIKTALSKILEIEKVEMKSATDEAGNILSWAKDTEIPEVEDVVYIEGEEKAFAPVGEYYLTNNIGERVKITVGEEGVVTSTEVVYEEVPVTETPVEAEETVENEPETAPEEVVEDETEADALKAENEALKAEIEALKAENQELKDKIAELEAEPQSKPVEEEFEAITKRQEKACGAVKYAQALNR